MQPNIHGVFIPETGWHHGNVWGCMRLHEVKRSRMRDAADESASVCCRRLVEALLAALARCRACEARSRALRFAASSAPLAALRFRRAPRAASFGEIV